MQKMKVHVADDSSVCSEIAFERGTRKIYNIS